MRRCFSRTARAKQQVPVEAVSERELLLAFQRWVVRGSRFHREYVTGRGQMYPTRGVGFHCANATRFYELQFGQ